MSEPIRFIKQSTAVDIDDILERAKSMIRDQKYLDAYALLKNSVTQILSSEKNADIKDGSCLRKDRYIQNLLSDTDGSSQLTDIYNACGITALCAAAAELCVLALGLGVRGAWFILTATDTAEKLDEYDGERLKRSKYYLRMLWYYRLMPDKQIAQTFLNRLSKTYPDEAFILSHWCNDIINTPDWDNLRVYSVNFYTTVPESMHDDVSKGTLLSVPFSNDAYMAAEYESILTSLEQGQHTKQNDYIWMQSLNYSSYHCFDLMKSIPTDRLSERERDLLYNEMLVPLTRHFVYREQDGFKTDYKNIPSSILKTLNKKGYTGLPCAALMRKAAENGGQVDASLPDDEIVSAVYQKRTSPAAAPSLITPQAKTDPSDYFTCEILEDHRVFISSTFQDMFAERDMIITYTVPLLDMVLRQNGMRLTAVDLRGIALTDNEEGYNRTCFQYCLNEIDKCDYFIGLIGGRYGWIPYDSATADRSFLGTVQKIAAEHGLSESKMRGKSMTHIEMMYALMNLKLSQCFFYVRNPSNAGSLSPASLNRFYSGSQDTIKSMIGEIAKTLNVSRIAPEKETGCNLQEYKADFADGQVTNISGLSRNIHISIAARLVSGTNRMREDTWYSRLISFWSETAHLTVPHPRLRELMQCEDRFIFVTGDAGIGKTVLLAQYWEMMRRQSIVIPVEALLEKDVDTIDKAINRVNEMLAYFRLKMPKGKKFSNNITLIFDGCDRYADKGMRIIISDTIRNSFIDSVRVIIASPDSHLSVPDYFKTFKLTEPPAPTGEIVKCTVNKLGKILNPALLERITKLAQTGGNHPLFTEYVTKAVLYRMQDDIKFKTGNVMDQCESELSPDIVSAASSILKRALDFTQEESEKRLIIEAVRQLIRSPKSSMTVSELIEKLSEEGTLPPIPRNKFLNKARDRYIAEQREKFIRIFTLLKPLLLFDATASVFTLAHRALAVPELLPDLPTHSFTFQKGVL